MAPGDFVQYHANGQKESPVHFNTGEQDGLETECDQASNKTLEIQYKDGVEMSR